MSKQQTTINPASAGRQTAMALKGHYGDGALATISGLDQVDAIKKTLNDTANDLSVGQSRYRCVTEAAVVLSAGKDNAAIRVGTGTQVPRWKKGSVVNFAAYSGGYPTPNHATFAAYRLNEAATMWNRILDGRVTLKWVARLEDAAFVLGYGGDGGSTLARAFFPSSEDLNTLIVYQGAFAAGTINSMTNIFLHEVGHALGLRHEFAAREGGSVPFGPPNPASVMSYNFPPQIQPSDETGTRAFYDYTGTTIGPLPVVDYLPDN